MDIDIYLRSTCLYSTCAAASSTLSVPFCIAIQVYTKSN
jgi:hypothetical protein